MNDLPPRQQEIIDAMLANINGQQRISVSYMPAFHLTTRRGWGTTARRSWEALVRKGLVGPTGDHDHIGVWYELAPGVTE